MNNFAFIILLLLSKSIFGQSIRFKILDHSFNKSRILITTDSSFNIDTVFEDNPANSLFLKRKCIVIHTLFDVIDGFKSSNHYLDTDRTKVIFFLVDSNRDTIGIDVKWSSKQILSYYHRGLKFYIQLLVSIYDEFGKEFTVYTPKVYYKKNRWFGCVRRLKIFDSSFTNNF